MEPTGKGRSGNHRCIFCKRIKAPGESWGAEHVIPDKFGNASKELILEDDEVCTDCNNGPLAQRDQDFLERFKLPAARSSVETRSGPPTHLGENFAVFTDASEPHVVIDEREGEEIGETPWKSNTAGGRIRETAFTPRSDGSANVGFEASLQLDQAFARALHKFAFEWAAKARGASYVLEAKFDNLREYIVQEGGTRHRPFVVITDAVVDSARVQPIRFFLGHPSDLEDHPALPEEAELQWPFVSMQLQWAHFVVSLADRTDDAQREVRTLAESQREQFRGARSIVEDVEVGVPDADGVIVDSFRSVDVCETPWVSKFCSEVEQLWKKPAAHALHAKIAGASGTSMGGTTAALTNLEEGLDCLLPDRRLDLLNAIDRLRLRASRDRKQQALSELRNAWEQNLKRISGSASDIVRVKKSDDDDGYAPAVPRRLTLNKSRECLRALHRLLLIAWEVRLRLLRAYNGVEGDSRG